MSSMSSQNIPVPKKQGNSMSVSAEGRYEVEKERWLMLTPSIFGEKLFDDWFDDLPFFDDRDLRKGDKKL